MTGLVSRPQPIRAPRLTAGSLLWFGWMEAMWGAFFALLVIDELDRVWTWLRDLPILGEVGAWVVAFPWLLGTAVWGSTWPGWLRLLLVLGFAIGWTLGSIPRLKHVLK